MSDETIGVYLCRCRGNIGDIIELESIAQEVSGMEGSVITNVQDYLCTYHNLKTPSEREG